MVDKSDNSFKMLFKIWFSMTRHEVGWSAFAVFYYSQYDLPCYLDGKHNILFSIDTI